MEAIPCSLSLFEKSPTLLTISDSNFERIQTKSVLDENVKQLQFTAEADNIRYTDLKSSYFIIKCHFTKADDSPLSDAPLIGPVNAPLTSMMKSVDMYLNDVRVSPIEANLPYLEYVQKFMMSKAAKETTLTTGLYIEDTMTSLETCNRANPQAEEGVNFGLKKRAKYFANSTSVTLQGGINVGLHNCDKLLFPKIKLAWNIELAPMEFFGMSTQPFNSFKFHIDEAVLMLRRVTVSPSLSSAHEQVLQSKNAVYPFKMMMSRSCNIPQNAVDFTFTNTFVGKQMPQAVFILFTKTSAKAGSLTQNPFCLYPLHTQELWVRMGGKKFPAVQEKYQTVSALYNTYAAIDCIDSNEGPGNLNRDTFENGAFIYGRLTKAFWYLFKILKRVFFELLFKKMLTKLCMCCLL